MRRPLRFPLSALLMVPVVCAAQCWVQSAAEPGAGFDRSALMIVGVCVAVFVSQRDRASRSRWVLAAGAIAGVLQVVSSLIEYVAEHEWAWSRMRREPLEELVLPLLSQSFVWGIGGLLMGVGVAAVGGLLVWQWETWRSR